MDRLRCDELARAFADGRLTRRNVWRVLGGGAFASAGANGLTGGASQAEDTGHVRGQADRGRRDRQGRRVDCRKSGIKCRIKAKKGTSPSSLCKNCCETFQKRSASAGKCCTANGQPCSSAAECCLGECSAGLCQNTTVQLPPPSLPEEPVLTVPPGAPPAPPPSCVGYGLSCTQSTDCCDGVPCSGSLCRYN